MHLFSENFYYFETLVDMVSHESITLVSLSFHFTSFKACFQGGKERSIINGGDKAADSKI